MDGAGHVRIVLRAIMWAVVGAMAGGTGGPGPAAAAGEQAPLFDGTREVRGATRWVADSWPVRAVDEQGPDSPVAETMRPLEEFHSRMIRQPPRVWLHPVLPPNSLMFPAGWTGGIDDPSASRNEALRHTWTSMDTLAYTQHVQRERQRQRQRDARRRGAPPPAGGRPRPREAPGAAR
jgi:hypothetical protein